MPLGSGNDFLKNFGTAEDFLDLEDNISGWAVPIDLMQVGEDQISAAICSVGLDAAVAYGIPKYRRIPFCGGKMAYNISIVENICKPMGHRMTVSVDGKNYTGNFLLARGGERDHLWGRLSRRAPGAHGRRPAGCAAGE